MEVRPTDAGGVGLYPEHAANLPWLEAAVAAAPRAQVLNLFAHTGLATLAMARAGAAVAHVDGARSAVAWARRNASLSGLADRPIRWLVDDAAAFVAREARRGRQYGGIVLDPPSYGHASGRPWRFEDDTPRLLSACRAVAAPGAFVLLTAHTVDINPVALAAMLRDFFPAQREVDAWSVELPGASGVTLSLGAAAGLAFADPSAASRASRGPGRRG